MSLPKSTRSGKEVKVPTISLELTSTQDGKPYCSVTLKASTILCCFLDFSLIVKTSPGET